MVMIEIREKKRSKLSDLLDCMEKTVAQARHCIESSSEDDDMYRRRRSGRYEEEDDDERDYDYDDEERFRKHGRSRY